jgi:hypothetical protein
VVETDRREPELARPDDGPGQGVEGVRVVHRVFSWSVTS